MLQIPVHSNPPRSDLLYPCWSIKAITQYSLLSTFVLYNTEFPIFCLYFCCFGFFECHGYFTTKTPSLATLSIGNCFISHPGPESGIRVLSVLCQPLNSLSTFALSFISLRTSLKLLPSSYSTLSNLLLAFILWHPGLSPTHSSMAGLGPRV